MIILDIASADWRYNATRDHKPVNVTSHIHTDVFIGIGFAVLFILISWGVHYGYPWLTRMWETWLAQSLRSQIMSVLESDLDEKLIEEEEDEEEELEEEEEEDNDEDEDEEFYQIERKKIKTSA